MREWIAEMQHNFERFELWLDEVRDLGDEVLAIGASIFKREEAASTCGSEWAGCSSFATAA
jgi:hypothetical protein